MDRSTAVVRSTHSSNFYEMPQLSPSRASTEQPPFASTWGPSSSSKTPASGAMRRGTNPTDLNASFQRSAPSPGGRQSSRNADAPQFQPAFAFDVNDLVSSLRRSAAMGNSSLSRSASSHNWPSRFTQHSQHGSPQFPEYGGDARIDSEPRRGRRDALSGSESAFSQAPTQTNPNSIIAYSLNRRKKKPIVGMPTSGAPPSPSPGGAPQHQQRQQQQRQQHQRQQQQYPYSPAPSTPSPNRIPSPPLPPTPSSSSSSHHPQYQQEFRPTTTIITPNGIEYTTEVPTRSTRVTSFYEESFTF